MLILQIAIGVALGGYCAWMVVDYIEHKRIERAEIRADESFWR